MHTLMYFFTQSILITFLVIMMMMLIEYVHVKTNGKLESLMQRQKGFQIVLAAFLGLIPGCMGGFAVVSLFTHRIIGFGALLAALIASFGDEAFFLFSFRPLQAAILSGILFTIAVIFGFTVNSIPFFNKKHTLNKNHLQIHAENCLKHSTSQPNKKYELGWKRCLVLTAIALFIVAVFTQFIGHAHVDFLPSDNHLHHEAASSGLLWGLSTEQFIFISLSMVVFLLIGLVNKHFVEEHIWNHVIKKHVLKIFIWTYLILFFIDILLEYIPLQENLPNSLGKVLWVGMAILIGIIPQSGPHLLFVFLFLEGIIPFSILLANSIVQEGHAGLPLIAESSKYFVWIKVIKIIVAIIIGMMGVWIGF